MLSFLQHTYFFPNEIGKTHLHETLTWRHRPIIFWRGGTAGVPSVFEKSKIIAIRVQTEAPITPSLVIITVKEKLFKPFSEHFYETSSGKTTKRKTFAKQKKVQLKRAAFFTEINRPSPLLKSFWGILKNKISTVVWGQKLKWRILFVGHAIRFLLNEKKKTSRPTTKLLWF